MRMRLPHAFPLLLATALALPGAAQALQIIQTDAFTIQTGGTATVGFQEFDPALGTLDKVSVFIDGTIGFNVTLAPSQLVIPQIAIDASGAGGRGFDFASSGATLQFAPLFNVSPTAPNTFGAATSFSLDFELTALTDLSGVVAASVSASNAAMTPPTNVEAQRGDFILGLAPIGISETLIFSPVGFSPSQISGSGLVALVYDYTPTQLAIPVAPAGTLFLAGIALLALLRRRGEG